MDARRRSCRRAAEEHLAPRGQPRRPLALVRRRAGIGAMTKRAPVRRMLDVQTPVIPVVSRWIAETPGTISLGQGIVSWGPPPEAIDALRAFPSHASAHRYGPVEGLPGLVDLIAAKLSAENGIASSGNRIVVTAGGNLAFMNAVLAITNPGDEIVLPVPYYFNHEMAIVMAGCRPVPVATDA